MAQKATFFVFKGLFKVMSSLVADVEALVQPLLQENGVELVDLTYQKEPNGWTLTFYLDKPGGIGLGDCEEWTRRLEPVLDQSNLMTHAYNLEISSPGLNRVLKKTSDFERFRGQRVHAKLYSALNGQKNFHGTLLGADEEHLRLKTDEGQDVQLPRNLVSKARLDPVIEFD